MTSIIQYKDHAIHYAAKIGQILKTMYYSPVGMAGFIPIIVTGELSTVERALIVLAVLFVVDFITGVWASYVEFKKSLPVLPGSGKRYVVQSSLLTLTAVKFIVYGLTLLVARAIEWAFIAPGIEFEPHTSLNKMTLTTIWAALLCVIEIYSILIENVKRIGFDIIQKIKDISGKGWDLWKSVKNDKTE